MRESKVERNLKKDIESQGGIAYKFLSPNRSGVPDRLILLPVPKEVRKIISQYMYFVECKSSTGKLRKIQMLETERIQKLGYKVIVKKQLYV